MFSVSVSSCCHCVPLGNFYGTPKPPAEPSPFQPDPVDQVLFDNEFDTESQRKRTTSVSKMERMDSSLPEEEEDEDKEAVNGTGLAGGYMDEQFPVTLWLAFPGHCPGRRKASRKAQAEGVMGFSYFPLSCSQWPFR